MKIPYQLHQFFIDVLAITEFFSHNRYRKIKDNAFKVNDGLTGFNKFYPILIFLCYLLKTPLTRPGSKPTNFLNKQSYNLENFLRLLIGLSSKNELMFQERLMLIEGEGDYYIFFTLSSSHQHFYYFVCDLILEAIYNNLYANGDSFAFFFMCSSYKHFYLTCCNIFSYVFYFRLD